MIHLSVFLLTVGLLANSCKTPEASNNNKLSGLVSKKLNKKNPLWKKSDQERWRAEGRCAAALLYWQKSNLSAIKPDMMAARKKSKLRVKAGTQLMQRIRQKKASELNFFIRAWQRTRLLGYLPKEENYAYIEMQKHFYSLFQMTPKEYFSGEQDDEQVFSFHTISKANRLRLSTAYFLNYFAEYVQLSASDALYLLSPFHMYGETDTFGHLGWVNYRDVMVADGNVSYKNRIQGTVIANRLYPVLPKEKDPAGQAYHFWGFASRRVGEDKLIGKDFATFMSLYYEQFSSKDNEDHYTDLAGITFADSYQTTMDDFKTKSAAQAVYLDNRCYEKSRMGLDFSSLPEKPIAWCSTVPSVEGVEISYLTRQFPIYTGISSVEQREETLKKCKAYAALSLSAHRSTDLKLADTVSFAVSPVDKAYRDPLNSKGMIKASEVENKFRDKL